MIKFIYLAHESVELDEHYAVVFVLDLDPVLVVIALVSDVDRLLVMVEAELVDFEDQAVRELFEKIVFK